MWSGVGWDVTKKRKSYGGGSTEDVFVGQIIPNNCTTNTPDLYTLFSADLGHVGADLMVEKNQIVAFTLDDQQFGLNLSSVERIVRAVEITPVPDSPTQIFGIINVEGQVMPVLNTRKWLGLPEREIELQDVFVIVSVNGHSIALVADEVKPVTEVPLNEVINSHEVIRSTGSVEKIAKLEDGLLMVLTAERAISLEELGKLDSVLSETESN